MKLIWSEESWDDYLYWQETDKRIVKKINELIKDTRIRRIARKERTGEEEARELMEKGDKKRRS